MVALLVTGTGAQASTAKPLSTISQVGEGSVLNLKLKLPTAVTSLLNTVLGAASIQLPDTIDETIAFSRSLGSRLPELTDNKVLKNAGSGIGRMFQGTLDEKVLTPVVQTLFGADKHLPIAEAVLGTAKDDVTDSLAEINVPSAGAALLHVGLMEVAAKSKPNALIANAVSSASSSKLLGVKVDLLPEVKTLLKSLLTPLTNLTDSAGGLIDTLNNSVLKQVEQIAAGLGLTVNLNLPKISDLIDRPLLSIDKIETSASTDAVGLARVAHGFSKITNINVFGTDASNALVHIDSLVSEASAQIDGTAGGAAATAIQKIVGVSVLDNELAVFNDHIQILGKTLPLPLNVVNDITSLVGGTLGLQIDVLKTSSTKTATFAQASSKTLHIGLHPTVPALSDLIGLDLTLPSAFAEVGGAYVAGNIIPGPKGITHPTGVADSAFLLAGPLLLGLAIVVRRFSLASAA
jgi:hypothetical protein